MLAFAKSYFSPKIFQELFAFKKFVTTDTNVSGYCTANITEGSCKKQQVNPRSIKMHLS